MDAHQSKEDAHTSLVATQANSMLHTCSSSIGFKGEVLQGSFDGTIATTEIE